jgi:3-phenylpropionate/trans-cinnamate dioxygenase ferredoxin subunit
MADYVSAGKTGDFQPGEMKVVNVDGKDVAVTIYDGTFYAFRNECTHQGVELANGFGELNGRRIMCALHDSSFDIKNGRVTGGPATEPLETYKVRVEGDDVLVGKDEK